MTPLDKYNELSQVYCIKPEGKIHCIQRVKQYVTFSGSNPGLGHIVQWVTCLAKDAYLTADPGVSSLILA